MGYSFTFHSLYHTTPVPSNPIPAAFLAVSVPFIAKDIISVIGAYLIADRIRKILSVDNI